MKYKFTLLTIICLCVGLVHGQSELDRNSISFGIDAKYPGLTFSVNYNKLILKKPRAVLMKIGIGTRHSYILNGGLIINLIAWKNKNLNCSLEYMHIEKGRSSFEPDDQPERSLYYLTNVNLLTPSVKFRTILDKTLRLQVRLGYGFVLNQPGFKLISGPDDYSKQMERETSNALFVGVEIEFAIRNRK
ncbi:MAG: hypothetical protein ACKVOK_12570 [Flavobacteriales bacterium]